MTTDFKSLSEKLINSYAKLQLSHSIKVANDIKPIQSTANRPVVNAIHSNVNYLLSHKDQKAIDAALDAIDLAKIYENIDKLEQENEKEKDKKKGNEEEKQEEKKQGKQGKENKGATANLKYDDLVVKEILRYFKHDFFEWVNTPKCSCGSDKAIGKGARRMPSTAPNPQKISIIEVYECQKFGKEIVFPRINNPVSLLETKKGRCGEWVNCFLLILEALIGDGGKDRVRFVWNQEDHVWVEYFSLGLQKWVHLDPCEAAFDEPLLYCENWGKKMSYVLGFNMNNVVDLSGKYITKEKQIPQQSIVEPKLVAKTLKWVNAKKLVQKYQNLKDQGFSESDALKLIYHEVIIPRNREQIALKEGDVMPSKTSLEGGNDVPRGRQTGSAEWTKARGEDGH